MRNKPEEEEEDEVRDELCEICDIVHGGIGRV